LVCNNFSIHPSINCPSPKNHSLKGAAQQPKQLVFNKSELNIVSKTLEICRYFIGKNQKQYQNSQDMVNEISTSINILNARQNNKSNLKGASSYKNKICNELK
jgi:hypothetical protein